MSMETAQIVEIGKTLDATSFPKLAKGKLRFVPFVMGTPEEVQPIVEGVAAERDISVDEVTIIAGGVRCAHAVDVPFAAFTYTYERLAKYPNVLDVMHAYIAESGKNYGQD